jgi:hypothetical protein
MHLQNERWVVTRRPQETSVPIQFDQLEFPIQKRYLMTPNGFPRGFDPTSSILFLGAGFSRSAQNVIGEAPPIGGELASKIKTLCDLPVDEPAGIQDLSRYAVDQGKNLHRLLSDLYTIKSLTGAQSKILSLPWLRIYTTNYDDAVEYHSIVEKKTKKESYSTADTVPTQLRPGAIVHLHGYIHKCQPSTVLQQLVLSHFSYAQQRAQQSPWWQVFERDIRVSQNLFFVGYELGDFEPASFLTLNPSLVERTHFILRPNSSPVITSRLREYGSRHDIAVEGFADECALAVVGQKPEHANSLRAFRFFDPVKDDKLAGTPTPIEIEALFALGKYDPRRLVSTYPKAEYVAPRLEITRSIIASLDRVKTVILHSKIGNGKTMYRHALSMALSQNGYSCFEVRENVTPPAEEIDFIRKMKKAAIVFPSYDAAYSLIHLFNDMSEHSRFIVEINTGTIQVRSNEIFQRFPKPSERYNLNTLSQSDLRDVHRILDKAGLAPKNFNSRFKSNLEFRDIVLSVFENAAVRSRIDEIVKPVLAKSEIKVVIICSAILKAAGIETDPSFLRAISGIDPYQVLTEAGENVLEFVDFAHDRIEPHSAIFSDFLVRHYLPPHELVAAIFAMAVEAARRMNEEEGTQTLRAREARATLGSLLRFSFLSDLLRTCEDKNEQIRTVYEHGRQNIYIQGEPLFWLQYSIFMQDSGRLDLAERHMETAYKRGAERTGFLTYQLDTNYLGLLMELELDQSKTSPVKRVVEILELIEKMRAFLAEGNHRGHVLKVLSEVEGFLRIRSSGLTRGEAAAFTFQINLLIDSLEALSPDERALYGTDSVKLSLSRGLAALTAN